MPPARDSGRSTCAGSAMIRPAGTPIASTRNAERDQRRIHERQRERGGGGDHEPADHEERSAGRARSTSMPASGIDGISTQPITLTMLLASGSE